MLEVWSKTFPTTSESPPENVGQKELKGETSITEQSHQIFIRKSNMFGMQVVKNTTGRCQTHQRAVYTIWDDKPPRQQPQEGPCWQAQDQILQTVQAT